MCRESQKSSRSIHAQDDCTVFSEDFCIAMDSTTQPVYIIDPQAYAILYCNKAVRSLSGCTPNGKPCYRDGREPEHVCAECLAAKLLKNGIDDVKEYRTPQGRWILGQVSPLRWKDRDLYMLICLDITERKRLEAQVRLRNKEYDALLKYSTTGIVRYEIATDVASVNVDQNLDQTDEHVIPHYSQMLFESGQVLPDSVPALEALFQDMKDGRLLGEYDVQMKHPTKDVRWLKVRYVLIEDEAGQPDRAIISFYDNTQKKEKELAYKNWSARLNALLNDHSVYMEVDLTSNLVEMESRPYDDTMRYQGHPFTEIVNSALQEQIYRKDWDGFRNFYDRTQLLGKFYSGEQECFLEYRVIYHDKFWWYRSEIRMIKDPTTDHVKASILLKDMDNEFRERDRLKDEAERDSMTGLYNHATAERLIRKVLKQNTGEQCCFLVVDLDDLRAINSDLGHPEGDKALKTIAKCMAEQFDEEDVLGRSGGDEFVALIRHVTSEEQLRERVFRFIDQLHTFTIGAHNDRPIHVSVGGSMGITGAIEFVTLYRQADLALYYTKAMGKNGFHLYRPALEKREFSYQPRSKVTMNKNDWSEAAEFKKLINAVSTYYPLVISANLTQNTFYMLEYENFTTQRAGDNGSFDQLILDGASTFHPDDRQGFLDCFLRENLLRSYTTGQYIVEHYGHQLGDDGLYRLVHTVGILSQDNATGDVCEVSFSHVNPL